MELIKVILSEENMDEALRRVKVTKGAPGIYEMPVSKLDEYFKAHKDEIKTSIMEIVERHIKYTKKIKLNARRHNVKFRSIQII